jgi:hypothetical protein
VCDADFYTHNHPHADLDPEPHLGTTSTPTLRTRTSPVTTPDVGTVTVSTRMCRRELARFRDELVSQPLVWPSAGPLVKYLHRPSPTGPMGQAAGLSERIVKLGAPDPNRLSRSPPRWLKQTEQSIARQVSALPPAAGMVLSVTWKRATPDHPGFATDFLGMA